MGYNARQYQNKAATKYHQGFFKPNHPEKYMGDITHIVYRSGLELSFMTFLDQNRVFSRTMVVVTCGTLVLQVVIGCTCGIASSLADVVVGNSPHKQGETNSRKSRAPLLLPG